MNHLGRAPQAVTDTQDEPSIRPIEFVNETFEAVESFDRASGNGIAFHDGVENGVIEASGYLWVHAGPSGGAASLYLWERRFPSVLSNSCADIMVLYGH